MDPLAEAMWLIRRTAGGGGAAVQPVARITAGLAVATTLLRLLLVESAEQVLPRPGEVSPAAPAARRPRRAVRARGSTSWGLHLEAAGDAGAAADRFRRAEAAVVAIVRHGQALREPVLSASGVAVEVFAADRLGRGAPAAARACAALAAGLAADSMPEWQLGRIGLARTAAAAGDGATARTLLADVADAGRTDPYCPGPTSCSSPPPQIESDGADAAGGGRLAVGSPPPARAGSGTSARPGPSTCGNGSPGGTSWSAATARTASCSSTR